MAIYISLARPPSRLLFLALTSFSLKSYQALVTQHADGIADFTQRREQAFAAELQRWIESGQINFESDQDLARAHAAEAALPEGCVAVESPVAGNVWEVLVKPGDTVQAGQALLILESMKMEILISAPAAGVVYAIRHGAGSQINAGQTLLILQEEHA